MVVGVLLIYRYNVAVFEQGKSEAESVSGAKMAIVRF
jgi:hypothetical protein